MEAFDGMEEFLYLEFCKGQPSERILNRFESNTEFRLQALERYHKKHPMIYVMSLRQYKFGGAVEEKSSSQEASNSSCGQLLSSHESNWSQPISAHYSKDNSPYGDAFKSTKKSKECDSGLRSLRVELAQAMEEMKVQ